MDVTDWSNEQIERMINGIYDGDISPARLPVDVYEEITKRLTSGVTSGFGGKLTDFVDGSAERDLLKHFEYNVAIFSGAKTHQQVVDMTREVFKDGVKQSFSDFKTAAGSIFDTYNKDWLKTEFNMAHQQAIFGRKWTDIQSNKDIFPKLKYVTTGDGRVRPDHVRLDGIVRPVDDPFWSRYYPPNDWGCRCNIEQITEDESPVTDDSVLSAVDYVPAPLFDGNVGIDKMIFNGSHPYFTVSQKYELLKANNFNLPTPPKPVAIAPEVLTAEKKIKDSFTALTGLSPDVMSAKAFRNCDPDLKFYGGESIPAAYKRRGSNFYYMKSTRSIHINTKTDRWKESDWFQKSVSTHEIGHSVHYNLKLIDNGFVSDRTKKFKDDLVESMNETFKHISNKRGYFSGGRSRSPDGLWSVGHKYLTEQGITNADTRAEMIAVLWDVVGGLTEGRFGGGHKLSYYRSNNGGMKEVFANLFEQTQMTDPTTRLLFGKLWPDAMKIADEYFNEVLK